jgi:hypothetical protein
MDLPLRGTLILTGLVLPYTAEVSYQVWLQARFLGVVPPAVRAAWPRHPRRAWLSCCASLRFQIAVLRYACRDPPDDPPDVSYWKRKMRASIVRESCLLGGLAITTAALVACGWRPIWP